MKYTEDYPRLIRKHFSYLIDDFGYKVVEDRYSDSSMSCIVSFKNDSRFVELIWGLHDVQFYFAVYKLREDGSPFPYSDSGEGFFYIFELAYHFEPGKQWAQNLDIGTATPTEELLEEKIRKNSEVLLKYGRGILTGKDWFDHKKAG